MASKRVPPPDVLVLSCGTRLERQPQCVNVDIGEPVDEYSPEVTEPCFVGVLERGTLAEGTATWHRVPSLRAFAIGAVASGLSNSSSASQVEATSATLLAEANKVLYLALSATAYRRYNPAVAAAKPEDAAAAPQAAEDGSPVMSPGRKTKDRLTSAVAFDFVSGIMQNVVGANDDELEAFYISQPAEE